MCGPPCGALQGPYWAIVPPYPGLSGSKHARNNANCSISHLFGAPRIISWVSQPTYSPPHQVSPRYFPDSRPLGVQHCTAALADPPSGPPLGGDWWPRYPSWTLKGWVWCVLYPKSPIWGPRNQFQGQLALESITAESYVVPHGQ